MRMLLAVFLLFTAFQVRADDLKKFAGPLCEDVQNYLDCAKLVEEESLNKIPRRAVRSGDSVAVDVKGELLVPEPREGAIFTYVQTYAGIDFHLFRLQFDEGSAYALIDARSGELTDIDNIPTFSNDKSRFFTLSSGGQGPNRIEYWKIQTSKGGIRKLNKMESVDPFPAQPDTARWISKKTVKVQLKQIDGTTGEFIDVGSFNLGYK